MQNWLQSFHDHIKDKTLKRFSLSNKSTFYPPKRNTEESRNLATQPCLSPTDVQENSSKVFSPSGRILVDLGHKVLYKFRKRRAHWCSSAETTAFHGFIFYILIAFWNWYQCFYGWKKKDNSAGRKGVFFQLSLKSVPLLNIDLKLGKSRK